MAREDHQPRFGEVMRPFRSQEERTAVCGGLAAIVLDRGDGLAQDAAEMARKAQIGCVEMVKPDECARGGSDFELVGVPLAVLEFAAGLPGEAVFVLDARQTAITEDHLYELALDLQGHPEADMVSSWISWGRRLPLLLRKRFLEGLSESSMVRPDGSGSLPVPALRMRDHVFGMEQLAAPPKPHEGVEAFFDGCGLTALQAVELARWEREHPGEKAASPNVKLSLMGPAVVSDLTESERFLVDVAASVSSRLGSSIDARMSAELDWADSFGARNRRDFPLLCDRARKGRLAYLDSAATAQRLGAAVEAQRQFDLHENANVYRGAYELSAQATFTYNDARKRLEDFIGAQRRQTVFVQNTTAACNLVAQAWGERNIGAGDLIVTTIAEHHSAMLPFALLAQRKGAQVEYLPLCSDGRIDQVAYREALEKGPKIVCIAHVGNVMGLEAPVCQMAAEAHVVGARFLLDAAQSFAHRKIDVKQLGADFVAFSGHKAYGPMGIGGLWISPSAFDEMDPIASGGGAVSHVATDSYFLRPQVIQYELGTPAVSLAVGFAAAVDYLDSLGMENVERHTKALTRYLVDGLTLAEGVNVLGDHRADDGLAGLVSFRLRNVAPGDLASFAGRLEVAIRSGGHCALPLHATLGLVGSGRISIGVYTTRAEVEAALVAIEACRAVYEGEWPC